MAFTLYPDTAFQPIRLFWYFTDVKMDNNRKWILWVGLSAGIGLSALAILYLYLPYHFARNFAGKKDPAYLELVIGRINFGTVRCNNLLQWDTIQRRIAGFYEVYPQYTVPDSLGIEVILCEGCAVITKPVYFSDPPREVYIVNFDMASFGYIEEIYKEQNGKFSRMETPLLDSLEKQRIHNRLETQMLSKINWRVDGIHF